MNNWLANCVAKLNAAIAFIIIIIGCILAANIAKHEVAILVAGGAFILAIMFCGPMAVILDIRDQLRKSIKQGKESS